MAYAKASSLFIVKSFLYSEKLIYIAQGFQYIENYRRFCQKLLLY